MGTLGLRHANCEAVIMKLIRGYSKADRISGAPWAHVNFLNTMRIVIKYKRKFNSS